MKKSILFFLANVLLVLVVGVIFGLTCGEHIFVNDAGTGAFVAFLLALSLPSVLYIASPKMTLGGRICSGAFIVCELALAIVFMCNPSFGGRAFWISEAIIIGIYLIALMIIVALFKREETK